jgi:hypothetical protein
LYLCDDCGAHFERCEQATGVWLEHFGHPCRETFDVCPNCRGDNFVPSAVCRECGCRTDASLIEEGFCQKCAEETIKKLNEFLDTLSIEQKEFLNARTFGVEAFA